MVRLKVTWVPQETKKTCWYAAACMVAYYFERGPRIGLPQRYQNEKQGLRIKNRRGVNEFSALAKAEGLVRVAGASQHWTAPMLETLLKDAGPIWAAGTWYGHDHIVVLTGVEGDKVYIKDPDPHTEGKTRVGSIRWFNRSLSRGIPDCMLRRPVHRLIGAVRNPRVAGK